MKRIVLIFLCVQCISLSGCRTSLDVSKAVAEKYQMSIQATVQISAIAGVSCDYKLECMTDANASTIEIIQPDSLAGIKATIESTSCRIQYEDIMIDSLMLPVPGMTPVDCFDQTIYSLRQEIPTQYSYEKRNETECLCLTYESEESGYVLIRTVWLNEDTMELLEGEYYLDGVLIMRMEVEEIIFTDPPAAE